MSPTGIPQSITYTTNVSQSDKRSNIISIFFGLAAVLFSIITIWQARRMWKAWVNRTDIQVFELATQDIDGYQRSMTTPTSSEEFGSPDSPSEPHGQFADLREIDWGSQTI